MAEEREEESTSPAIAENQISVEEMLAIIPQEQNLQEENNETEESQKNLILAKRDRSDGE